MGKLSDAVKKQEMLEQEQAAINSHSKKSTVASLSGTQGSKDKQISAKVNETTYAAFTMINKAQGVSNNSCINLLISRYVRDNKDILESGIDIESL